MRLGDDLVWVVLAEPKIILQETHHAHALDVDVQDSSDAEVRAKKTTTYLEYHHICNHLWILEIGDVAGRFVDAVRDFS
jgi:hypothetical protein